MAAHFQPILRGGCRQIGFALFFAVAASSAVAQFRVVGPDGRVTFTDRPPMDSNQKVEPIRGGQAAGASGSALPFELQRVVQQFPVTLFTSSRCTSCADARSLLRQRGVPFTEKTVETDADQRAFGAISRDLAVPTVRIGSQVVSGYEAGEWTSYLNAAGYPASSRLPSTYQNPAASPLVARSEAAAPARGSAPADGSTAASDAPTQGPGVSRRGSAGPAPSPVDAAPPATNPSGIRF